MNIETYLKMSKLIFITDVISTKACQNPTKIAHLYMNRFAIDEDAAFEIIAVESFSATETHLEPNFGSEPKFVDELAMKTLENFDRSKSVIEKALNIANQFEKNLNLPSHDKLNIHLIYAGNPFNWISGLDRVSLEFRIGCLNTRVVEGFIAFKLPFS